MYKSMADTPSSGADHVDGFGTRAIHAGAQPDPAPPWAGWWSKAASSRETTANFTR